jgi:hypothetical protein
MPPSTLATPTSQSMAHPHSGTPLSLFHSFRACYTPVASYVPNSHSYTTHLGDLRVKACDPHVTSQLLLSPLQRRGPHPDLRRSVRGGRGDGWHARMRGGGAHTLGGGGLYTLRGGWLYTHRVQQQQHATLAAAAAAAAPSTASASASASASAPATWQQHDTDTLLRLAGILVA